MSGTFIRPYWHLFQVPNSLPNRNNIEIEIYGMEGIPPEDAKEHERQKAGGGIVTGGSEI